MGEGPTFSHLDAASRSLGMDQSALLKILALKGEGSKHFGEIPVRARSHQEVNAAILLLLRCAANDGQHFILLQKGSQ